MIRPSFDINNSSINAVKAKVELYNGSTLVKTCTCSDFLQNVSVSRIGENNKFFGYGICQKATINLIDLDRILSISKGFIARVAFGDGTNFVYPYPPFYVEEVTRDENSNGISLVCYDKLYQAANHTFSEVGEYMVDGSFMIGTVVSTCCDILGLNTYDDSSTYGDDFTVLFDDTYETPMNVDGTETLRFMFNVFAEYCQAVYYLDANEILVFKRLDKSGDPVYTITKDDYFSLSTGDSKTITAIGYATELGDNTDTRQGDETGVIQWVRENPLWYIVDVEGYLASYILPIALENVGGTSINQFNCDDWIGNYLLEIGDKISIITEDGSSVISYILNDTITYDGTLSEATQWVYEDNEGETASNPASLGEKLNQTFARVDKANKQIEQVVSDTSAANNRISALEINAEGVSATVSEVKASTEQAIGAINENFETLSQQVSAKVSAEDVKITIESEMSKGVDKVTTSTGFTFNEEGLSVSKSGSEMTTQITEDGMKISRSGQETLVADNTGVKAENLHATTYLIIGNTSRFEDWNGRTGCFWIGG